MKHKYILLTLAASLLLVGCDNGDENSSSTSTTPTTSTTSTIPSTSTLPPAEEDHVVVNFEGINPTAKKGGYNAKIYYRDDDFNQPSTTFSDKIKMLSFGASVVSSKESKAQSFYSTMGYDNFVSHLPEPGSDTIGYVFAHKSLAGYDLVSVSIRGLDYGAEWASNLDLGEEGNHHGFEASANEVKTALNTYLASYTSKPVKVWITGYSRAGGVANVLASALLKDGFTQTNLFVYTFEAPRGLVSEDAIEYENVFNIVNEIDIVTRIAPEEYGLYRCGKDIFINEDTDIDEALTKLDPNLSLPAFTSKATYYENEKAFTDFILDQLLQDTGNVSTSLDTREKFYANYQTHISYFLGLYFSMSQEAADAIVEAIKNLGMDAASLLSDEDGIYKFIKPLLDEHGVSYDDAKLQGACHALYYLATSKALLLVLFALDTSAVDNLKRMLYMHSLETVYALIK